MIKVGLIGIGAMGSGHFNVYERLEKERSDVKLVAICDVDKNKFGQEATEANIDFGKAQRDFSKYHLYTDIDEMLSKEDLDYVDMPLPTYIHAEAAIKALNKGLNVLCEKPMALNSADCLRMIDAAKANNRLLMIGQCLRLWPEYEYLKDYIDSNKFGKVLAAYFFRGGSTPLWSYENWLMKKELSGGCLMDQHIHDVDAINWLFGKPKYVSTFARNVVPGGGYDIVSTNYVFDDNLIINAQDDWMLNGDYGFDMKFRVTFEKGNIIFEKGVLTVNPNEGKAFIPEISKESAYYREIVYYIESLISGKSVDLISPESTMETIKIAEAEMRSADNGGKLTEV